MEYINDINFELNTETVVTFGKFDGLHNGHKLLISKALEIARYEGLKLVLCTFDMSCWCKTGNCFITDKEEKKKLCESFGVDILIDYPFDDKIAELTPEMFVDFFVRNKINAKYVVVGSDWRFGHKRSGDINVLKELQKKYGFKAVILEKILNHDKEISSTWIREEIANGNMKACRELLGYPFFFFGQIVHGKKLGRTIGFPTINIIPTEGKILPKFGVYLSKVHFDGKKYDGVTNVGIRPTVDDKNHVTVETFILDFLDDVYDKNVYVELIDYIREEQKFSSVDELKLQLQKDIKTAKSMLKNT